MLIEREDGTKTEIDPFSVLTEGNLVSVTLVRDDLVLGVAEFLDEVIFPRLVRKAVAHSDGL